MQAKHYLQSVAMTQQTLIAVEDVTTIFYKLDDIFQIHKEFVDDLEKKVTTWSDDQNIGDTFKTLVSGILIDLESSTDKYTCIGISFSSVCRGRADLCHGPVSGMCFWMGTLTVISSIFYFETVHHRNDPSMAVFINP